MRRTYEVTLEQESGTDYSADIATVLGSRSPLHAPGLVAVRPLEADCGESPGGLPCDLDDWLRRLPKEKMLLVAKAALVAFSGETERADPPGAAP